MELLIRNSETGETRVLRPLPEGRVPEFAPPWQVTGMVGGVKKKPAIGAPVVQTVDVDDKLNKLAAMLFIPAADIAQVVGKALGIECAYCQLRFQIWKKAREIGWWKVIYLTAKSIKAQIFHDEAKLKEMAKELE